ncbi:MAG: cation-translocating P-type ATPase [Firmicutes bacterium]|nr:cation-translocating P-type ATPase [Bacillota bacterium]
MKEISVLPGRVRFLNPALKHNKPLSKYINVYIDHLSGVKHSRVNHTTATILVEYDTRKIDRQLLKKNIAGAVSAALNQRPQDLNRYGPYYETLEKSDKAARRLVIFGLIYLFFKVKQSLYGKFSLAKNVKVLQVASAVTIVGGYPLLKGLYRRLARNVPSDSDILLSLTALSLTIMRESAKGVFVLVLKELNDYIKLSAEAQCMRLLNQSLGKTAGMAWRRMDDSREELVGADTLQAGDLIRVHPGELVPADGRVIDGRAVINSLYYTGQPTVSRIEDGHRVHEGIAIVSGELVVRVDGAPETGLKPDITTGEMEIQGRVNRYQELITPLSLGAGTLSYLLTGSVLRAMSVLLVLTPSAVGTALSTGIKSYVSLLNKHRIYVKNPNTIEKAIRTDKLVFDKTGTLTHGIMKIAAVEVFDADYTRAGLLRLCAACEVDNYHPISVTLQEEVMEDYDVSKVESSVLIPSKGIAAQYDGRNVLIGSRALMKEHNVNLKKSSGIYSDYEKRLLTPVLVSIDGKLAGLIGMEDVVRDGALQLIRRLKQIGIKDISLLTGDVYKKANHLASQLGIESVYARRSYKDKLKVIRDNKKNSTVMMVGDGVNDVLAMRNADISVSYADASCDKIKMNSDCIIFEDDITRLADFISLSRNSYAGISRSIAFSQLYNLFFGALAVAGSFDAFAAKSLNTVNSILVLLLNKRIEYLSPDKREKRNV